MLCRAVLGEKDVLKIDIGVHVKGRICDSAFTLTFDPTYDKLLEAVKAATDTGVRVRLREAGLAPTIDLTGSLCRPPGSRYRRAARRASWIHPGDYGVLRGRGEWQDLAG